MTNLQRILLALCLCASYANAAVITQTQIKTFPAQTPSDTSIDMVFDKFDTSLGTLESIQIIFNLSVFGGSILVDNDSETSANARANLTVLASLNSLDVGLKNENRVNPWEDIESKFSINVALDPTVGDTVKADIPDPNPTNISYINNTGLGDSRYLESPLMNKNIEDNVGITYLSGYQGTGTYTIGADLMQGASIIGNAGLAYTPMQASGSVTVIYNYTPVPEPATASLAGVGLLLLLRRRRKA